MKTYTIDENAMLHSLAYRGEGYKRVLKFCTNKKIYFKNRYYRTGDIYLITKATGNKLHVNTMQSVIIVTNKSIRTANGLRKHIVVTAHNGYSIVIVKNRTNSMNDCISVDIKDIIYIGNIKDNPEYLQFTSYMTAGDNYDN